MFLQLLYAFGSEKSPHIIFTLYWIWSASHSKGNFFVIYFLIDGSTCYGEPPLVYWVNLRDLSLKYIIQSGRKTVYIRRATNKDSSALTWGSLGYWRNIYRVFG